MHAAAAAARSCRALVVITVAFAACTLLASSEASASASSERARDAGETMRRVDRWRAEGEYERAADELRGLIERFNHAGMSLYGNDLAILEADLARMRALMATMVELQQLLQEAADDGDAARRYLAKLTSPLHPSTRTAEQARGLRLLARHDKRVAVLIDAAFPARLELTMDAHALAGQGGDPNLVVFPMENALIEVSRADLPITRGAGAATLRVHVTMYENDRRNALLEGTSMKSYAMSMTAELVGADDEIIARAATTTSSLGINPGFAAKYGTGKCAQLIYASLVEEIAKRATLDVR